MEKLSLLAGRFTKIIRTTILYGIGALALLVIARVLFLNSIYSFFLEWNSSDFGIDIAFARPIAVFMTALSLLIIPWIVTYLFFGQGKAKQKLIIATMIGSLVFIVGTYFITGNVYFDRSTGEYSRCYLKTLSGFKFSSTCDYDPEFGTKYEPITPDIINEILLWENSGSLQNVPSVQEGRYFDQLTGEPIVWYSINPNNNKIRLFPLPGYDPLTGEQLKPVTQAIVGSIQERGYEEVSLVRQVSLLNSVVFPKDEFDLFAGRKKDFFGNPIYARDSNTADERAAIVAWYRQQPLNISQTEVRTATEGDYSYSFSVEKAIFTEEYTVVGLGVEVAPLKQGQLFNPIKFSYQSLFIDNESHVIEGEFSIIDGPTEYVYSLGLGGRDLLSLNQGQKGTILFVLERSSPSAFSPAILQGSISGQIDRLGDLAINDFLLRFRL